MFHSVCSWNFVLFSLLRPFVCVRYAGRTFRSLELACGAFLCIADYFLTLHTFVFNALYTVQYIERWGIFVELTNTKYFGTLKTAFSYHCRTEDLSRNISTFMRFETSLTICFQKTERTLVKITETLQLMFLVLSVVYLPLRSSNFPTRVNQTKKCRGTGL